MKKIIVAVLMSVTMPFMVQAETLDLNKSVVSVNGQFIKESDLQEAINLAVTRGAENNSQLRENVLNTLINQKLLEQQAQKEGADKNPQVQAQIKDAETMILIDYALQQYIEKNPISNEEVQKIYDDLAKQVAEQKEVRIRHILVKDEKEANKLLVQLSKNQIDFMKAAEKSEDTGTAQNGGELGYQLLANLIPEIQQAVANAKVGLINKPVKSEFGWHIIEVEDPVKPVSIASFETLVPQIRQQLVQQSVQRYVQELRDAAKIERSK
ncbi:peptidylprolyl isomerase [Volucribacter amazonae]|uniref:peptidylprolyl isomerase n=1 Tax=Volucribacter amazonae TaxID=256731 RepID=A0A9X4SHB5_9PAST|nr:peptidylprolyl isomerase [Volucribacter amazonae]MDG6894270.1 hypothetical protein [Volucribacter amazonae]